MANEQKPIWYLPGPNFQYVEDVKALAREAGLRIIDANVTSDRSDEAEDPPKVTLKSAALEADAAEPQEGKLTVAQLREELTARGIAFEANAKKADLQALLDAQ
jgi:hypothetical protein